MENYVCSDIHGLGTRYSKLTDKYSNDKIYILGDAIDNRYPGEQGIRILQDIMTRSNVELLMGNHELMFIESVGFFYTLLGQGYTEAKAYDICLKDAYVKNWVDDNNGKKTFEDFLKLPNEQRKKIYNYLTSLPISKKMKILDHGFYLVHAAPVKVKLQSGKEVLYNYNGKTLLANDLLKISRESLHNAVWTRYEDKKVDELMIPRTHVIIGHTPTVDGRIKYIGKDKLVIVDCNSRNAYQYRKEPYKESNLGVLSLEKKTEDYIHEI